MSMICSAPGWSASSAAADEIDASDPPAEVAIDVVLLQTSADDGQLAWVQRLRARYAHTPFVVIGPENGRDVGSVAALVGAKRSLSFSLGLDAVLEALRLACSGDRASTLPTPMLRAPRSEDHLRSLTARETEIVRRLSAAQPSEHIAASMGISANTLRTHLRNIMVKLGAHSRVEIVARARHLGLLHAGAGAPR